jgi:hypothetical protein
MKYAALYGVLLLWAPTDFGSSFEVDGLNLIGYDFSSVLSSIEFDFYDNSRCSEGKKKLALVI